MVYVEVKNKMITNKDEFERMATRNMLFGQGEAIAKSENKCKNCGHEIETHNQKDLGMCRIMMDDGFRCICTNPEPIKSEIQSQGRETHNKSEIRGNETILTNPEPEEEIVNV